MSGDGCSKHHVTPAHMTCPWQPLTAGAMTCIFFAHAFAHLSKKGSVAMFDVLGFIQPAGDACVTTACPILHDAQQPCDAEWCVCTHAAANQGEHRTESSVGHRMSGTGLVFLGTVTETVADSTPGMLWCRMVCVHTCRCRPRRAPHRVFPSVFRPVGHRCFWGSNP